MAYRSNKNLRPRSGGRLPSTGTRSRNDPPEAAGVARARDKVSSRALGFRTPGIVQHGPTDNWGESKINRTGASMFVAGYLREGERFAFTQRVLL